MGLKGEESSKLRIKNVFPYLSLKDFAYFKGKLFCYLMNFLKFFLFIFFLTLKMKYKNI